LRCVAVCRHRAVLQCVAVCRHRAVLQCVAVRRHRAVLQCVVIGLCCSVLQCVVIGLCCSVLQCVVIGLCCSDTAHTRFLKHTNICVPYIYMCSLYLYVQSRARQAVKARPSTIHHTTAATRGVWTMATFGPIGLGALQCVSVCCSVLQCVAVCCSECVAMCCSVM